jgi:hypothetical protein
LVLPSEVVPLIVPVGELTHLESVSGDSGLAVEISQVLDISLSKVNAQYFGGSDASNEVEKVLQGEWDHLQEDLQEQEQFKENSQRRREADTKSYHEDSSFWNNKGISCFWCP